MRSVSIEVNLQGGSLWFAWYPVKTNKGWKWLAWVYKRHGKRERLDFGRKNFISIDSWYSDFTRELSFLKQYRLYQAKRKQ